MQVYGFEDEFNPEEGGEEEVAGFKSEFPPGVPVILEILKNSFAFLDVCFHFSLRHLNIINQQLLMPRLIFILSSPITALY